MHDRLVHFPKSESAIYSQICIKAQDAHYQKYVFELLNLSK